MSTLSATNLKNASSGSNNVVLGTGGDTTVTNNLLFNSGYGSAATAYGCRAWVNFNGTGTTSTNQTIRGSGNVSSVFKNGTGNYTVNFTTAMPDANYNVVASAGIDSSQSRPYTLSPYTFATGSLSINTHTVNSSAPGLLVDTNFANVAIFR